MDVCKSTQCFKFLHCVDIFCSQIHTSYVTQKQNDTHQYTPTHTVRSCTFKPHMHRVLYYTTHTTIMQSTVLEWLPAAFGIPCAQQERSPGTFLEQCMPVHSQWNDTLGNRWRSHRPFTYAQRKAGVFPEEQFCVPRGTLQPFQLLRHSLRYWNNATTVKKLLSEIYIVALRMGPKPQKCNVNNHGIAHGNNFKGHQGKDQGNGGHCLWKLLPVNNYKQL